MPEPPAPALDLAMAGQLTFGEPDISRFPCLGLAMESGRLGGTYPAAMAAADEVAVERFMAGEVGFLDIPGIIEGVMERHESTSDPDLEAVFAADTWARAAAEVAPAGAGA